MGQNLSRIIDQDMGDGSEDSNEAYYEAIFKGVVTGDYGVWNYSHVPVPRLGGRIMDMIDNYIEKLNSIIGNVENWETLAD